VRSRSFLLASVVLGALALLGWLVLRADPEQPGSPHADARSAAPDHDGLRHAALDGLRHAAASPLSDRLRSGSASIPQREVVPDPGDLGVDGDESDIDESDLEATPAVRVWQLGGRADYRLEQPIADYHPERRALVVDRDVVAALAVGDDVRFALPGLGDVEATVDTVRVAPNGDVRISAFLDGYDDEFRLTLTQGRDALFGQIETPAGRFQVEGTGEIAALLEDDLDETLVDTSHPDSAPHPREAPL
jgi:hypothetical protein